MRVLVTGGSGVLGRALLPRLQQHEVSAPGRDELDLFDADAVRAAAAGRDAVVHLATRVGRWEENDRLRAVATPLLVDAAVAAGAQAFVFPSVAFIDHPAVAQHLASCHEAERQVARFPGRAVILRLGLLWRDAPDDRYGATLHVDRAGEALAEAVERSASGTYTITDSPRR